MTKRRLAAGLLAATFLAVPALAQTPGPVQVPPPAPAGPRFFATYVESRAGATKALARHLAAYAQAQRSGPGAPTVLVLSQIGRPNRMVVLEGWDRFDPAAGDAAGQALQEATAGDIEAPLDRRPNLPFTPFLKNAPPGALHMVMHVDVVPDGIGQAAAFMRAQAASVMAAKGALGFEAGTQSDRANHFAVHEVWATRADYEAYAASPAGQELRKQINAIKGAPFDDIFYTTPAPARAGVTKVRAKK